MAVADTVHPGIGARIYRTLIVTLALGSVVLAGCSKTLTESSPSSSGRNPALSVGQTQSRCRLVSYAEVIDMLGGRPTEDQNGLDWSCIFTLPGDSAVLIAQDMGVGSFAPQSFANSRNDLVKGGIVKDEPELGSKAYSFVKADASQRASGFFVLRNPTNILQVAIIETHPGGAPPSTKALDKLRPLIKKILGRLR